MNNNTLKSGSLLKHSEYRIIRVLGQGGFGITYEAEQVSLGRKVAVKEFFMKDYCDREDGSSHVTLSTSSSSRELVERFRTKFVREAKMIAGLDHDHIVKIIDVFEENGTAYYVMEYLGGGCLGDGVKAGKAMPEPEAVESIRQIASALEYLHNKGIIHFDVKPSNVLKTEDGKLKLIDFGISKHYDEAGVQTSSTPVGISKGYAPLEQYQQGSDIKSFTPATDIYSLGATLYALLTGSNPPEASIVNEDGVPAIEGISPVVMRAIEKAMQPRRKDRPQSVRDLIDLLDGKTGDDEKTVVPSKPKESVSESKPKETSPAKLQQTTSEEKKQRKPFAKYGLIGGLAIIAILSVMLFLNRGGQPEPADSMMIDGTAECVAEFASTAAEREFKIEKNFEERWTYTGVPEWCSVKAEEGKIVLSVTENKTKEDRTATVEFRKKDGEEVLANLTVNQTPKGAKGQQQVEEKACGSVKISSTPSGASIWIDGKDTKKTTPEIIENLTVGSHKVVLKLSGYEDASGRTTVKENERAELTLTLAKVAEPEQPSQPVAESKPANSEPVRQESSKPEQSNSSNAQVTPSTTVSNSTSAPTPTSVPTVNPSSLIPTGTHNGHGYVDLGLSVKWATTNVGANTPEGNGNCFAWGESRPKSEFNWGNLKYCKDKNGDNFSKYATKTINYFGPVDNKIILDKNDDAATVNWKGNWRMPTEDEMIELVKNCKWTWSIVNGKNGFVVSSLRNGNSIFLPATGYCDYEGKVGTGSIGNYWSSSLNEYRPFRACSLVFESDKRSWEYSYRYLGFFIRPVL